MPKYIKIDMSANMQTALNSVLWKRLKRPSNSSLVCRLGMRVMMMIMMMAPKHLAKGKKSLRMLLLYTST